MLRQYTREAKHYLMMGILMMNSIFLGYMNSRDLHVNRSIAVAEGFAATCFVLGRIGLRGSDPEARDVLFMIILEAFYMGSYIFIATVYKRAPKECKGYADTPFGEIVSECGLPSVRDSCGMQRANFALSIIVAILSGGCILLEVLTAYNYARDNRSRLNNSYFLQVRV